MRTGCPSLGLQVVGHCPPRVVCSRVDVAEWPSVAMALN